MTDSAKPPLTRAVEVLVYAPLGLAAFARDTLPSFLNMFVARGRTELEQRHRQVGEQVSQAKAIGHFAVGYGVPEVRRKVEQTFSGLTVLRNGATESPTRRAPANGSGSGSGSGTVPAGARVESTASSTAPVEQTVTSAPPVASLAIPDYDELSASQVVERLAGLGEADLQAVGAYESAHRGRSTILGKITQLSH